MNAYIKKTIFSPAYWDGILTSRNIKQFLWISVFLIVAVGLVRSGLRLAKNDDSYYVLEASIMADCLRQGQWFGNEAVGLHGFLFKVPAALLMMVFGKSVFAATMTTVLFAAGAFVLLYSFLRRVLSSEPWALAGAWLLASNYYFIWTTPRFLREIPVVFALLVLMNVIAAKKSKWIIGLAILLLLDAKEYVFIIFAPMFALWVIIDEWSGRAGKTLKNLVDNIFSRCVAGFLPSLVYMVLMFCTGIVPLNTVLASLIGLKQTGMAYALKHFAPEVAVTSEVAAETLAPFQLSVPSVPAAGGADAPPSAFSIFVMSCWRHVVIFINIITGYLAKLLFPSTFSFVGIPKVIAVPSLFMTFYLWRKRSDIKDRTTLLWILFLWFYTLIIILRASHSRYYLPVLPILVLFFVHFLRELRIRFSSRFLVYILLSTMIVLGFLFDEKSVLLKVVLNAAIVSLMLLAAVARRKEWALERAITAFVPASIIVGSLTVAWASCLTDRGQVGSYLLFGSNMECKEVTEQFRACDRVWVNNMKWSHLVDFYRGDRPETPEWHWSIKSWLPKKKMLNLYPDRKTYRFRWNEIDEFRRQVVELNINKVGLVVSTVERYPFTMQDKLKDLKESEWLLLEDVVPFKNKTLYIFDVSSINRATCSATSM